MIIDLFESYLFSGVQYDLTNTFKLPGHLDDTTHSSKSEQDREDTSELETLDESAMAENSSIMAIEELDMDESDWY